MSHRKKRRSHSRENRREEKEKAEGKRKNRSSGRISRHKDKGSSSSSKAPTKVRSVHELVKMVMTGEIKVPQRLRHHAEDRGQLLEQVFSILPEKEITDMLPDILKGLRMKQVKQLCLQQLERLSLEEVLDILEPNSETSNELNVDAAVMQLVEEEEEEAVREREKAKGGGGGAERERVGEGGGGSRDGVLGRGESGKRKRTEMVEGFGGEGEQTVTSHSLDFSERKKRLRSEEKRKEEQEEDEEEQEEDEEEQEEDEEEEDERWQVTQHAMGDKDEEAQNRLSGCLEWVSPVHEVVEEAEEKQLMECDTTTHTITSNQFCQHDEMEEEEREEEEAVREEEKEEAMREEEEGNTSDSSDLGDCWLSDFPSELPETARLQEVELRKRALEAALRRETAKEEEEGKEKEEEEEEGEEKEEEEEEGEEKEEEEGEEDQEGEEEEEEEEGEEEERGGVDKLEALELQLRQRALQSLLAKKKEQH